jgi:ABC-type uncharacterized transport system auxiliary subunit
LLHGRLYDFKEVSAGSLIGRVTMEVELRNIKDGTTVWTHFYTRDEKASSKDTGAVVAALDKCVQDGVMEFRAGVDQYFAEHPPAPTPPTKTAP